MHKNIDVYDTNEKRIGTLTNQGMHPQFYDMTRHLQSEDNNTKSWQDTLTITVPNDLVWKLNIREYGTLLGCYRPNGHYYFYEVEIIDEDYNGVRPVKKITALNLLQYSLTGNILNDSKTFVDKTSSQILPFILQRSGWYLDEQSVPIGGVKTFEIQGGDNAMSALSSLVEKYNLVLDAYVEPLKYGRFRKYLYVSNKIGHFTYQTIEFKHGLIGFNRQVSREPGIFATRVYPKTSDGKGIESIEGVPYLEDGRANDLYNANHDGTYIEKTITNETGITNLYALRDWGKAELKKLSTPPYIYTFNTSFLPDNGRFNELPDIGDGYYFKNFDIEPKMIVKGYVTAVDDSYTNPEQNKVTCGDYRTIKYSVPKAIEALRLNAARKADLLKDIQKASHDVSLIDVRHKALDGTDFNSSDEHKRIVMQAFTNGRNISAWVDKRGFVWTAGAGGNDYKYGNAYIRQHGYLTRKDDTEIGTWNAQIDNKVIMSTPEIDIPQDSWAWTYKGWCDARHEDVARVPQYCQKVQINGQDTFITSHACAGNDTVYVHRDNQFRKIDEMRIKNGGHGAMFGVKLEGSTIWLYISRESSSGAKYRVTKIKYQGGATISDNASNFAGNLNSNKYVRTNYDPTSDYQVLSYMDGTVKICNSGDIYKGIDDPLYTINLTATGWERANIFQSGFLRFPYFYWLSGDTSKGQRAMIHCINVVHGGSCLDDELELSNTKAGDPYNEPESISLWDNGNVLVSFNNYEKWGGATSGRSNTYFYQLPIRKRELAGQWDDKGSMIKDEWHTGTWGEKLSLDVAELHNILITDITLYISGKTYNKDQLVGNNCPDGVPEGMFEIIDTEDGTKVQLWLNANQFNQLDGMNKGASYNCHIKFIDMTDQENDGRTIYNGFNNDEEGD